MTWEIFLGIVAIVGFFVTVGTPIIKLNTSIIKLNESVKGLHDTISKFETDNKEAHADIWKHMDSVDESIKNHDDRLTKAESVLQVQKGRVDKLEIATADQEHRITVNETEITDHDRRLTSHTNQLNDKKN